MIADGTRNLITYRASQGNYVSNDERSISFRNYYTTRIFIILLSINFYCYNVLQKIDELAI